MPFAANGQISTTDFDGAIKISQKQYDAALAAMLEGKFVRVDGGFAILDEAPKPPPALAPDPTPDQVEAQKRAAINAERDRRINAGVTVSVTGYGDIPVQGREEDRINTLALKDTARDLIAAGITDPIVPFRDGDNVLHMLTPAQTAELANKGKTAAAAIYQVAWAMKDGTAPFEAGIPDDITDDQWWP